ncbi:hypothetical protein BDZ91DRAFT_752487, partial [Kalaharituber pfeilii]
MCVFRFVFSVVYKGGKAKVWFGGHNFYFLLSAGSCMFSFSYPFPFLFNSVLAMGRVGGEGFPQRQSISHQLSIFSYSVFHFYEVHSTVHRSIHPSGFYF